MSQWSVCRSALLSQCTCTSSAHSVSLMSGTAVHCPQINMYMYSSRYMYCSTKWMIRRWTKLCHPAHSDGTSTGWTQLMYLRPMVPSKGWGLTARTSTRPPATRGRRLRAGDSEGAWANSLLKNVAICRGFQGFSCRQGAMVHQKRLYRNAYVPQHRRGTPRLCLV